jgi:hypothetical protein
LALQTAPKPRSGEGGSGAPDFATLRREIFLGLLRLGKPVAFATLRREIFLGLLRLGKPVAFATLRREIFLGLLRLGKPVAFATLRREIFLGLLRLGKPSAAPLRFDRCQPTSTRTRGRPNLCP